MNDLLKQQWHLLGPPWAYRNNAGTTILAGSDDPNIAQVVCDTYDMFDTGITLEAARAVSEHIVRLHNEDIKKLSMPGLLDYSD